MYEKFVLNAWEVEGDVRESPYNREIKPLFGPDINGVEDAHCAAYPQELPARLIKMFSYVEDWILDPFLGSGTTMKAAKDLGRNSVGIELNPDYLTRIEEKAGIKQSDIFTGSDFEVVKL